MSDQDHSFQLLTKDDAAALLRVSTRTLDRRHAEGIGPPRIKHGAKVGYLKSSLEAWLSVQEKQPVRGHGLAPHSPAGGARPSGRARAARGADGGGICNTPLHEYTKKDFS